MESVGIQSADWQLAEIAALVPFALMSPAGELAEEHAGVESWMPPVVELVGVLAVAAV